MDEELRRGSERRRRDAEEHGRKFPCSEVKLRVTQRGTSRGYRIVTTIEAVAHTENGISGRLS